MKFFLKFSLHPQRMRRFLYRAGSTLSIIWGMILAYNAAFSQLPVLNQIQSDEWWAWTDSSVYYSVFKNDLPNALRCASQAQQIGYKLQGENSIGYIVPYKLMAQAYYRTRDFGQAVHFGEILTRRLQKILDPSGSLSLVNRQYSSGLLDLAEIYRAAGKNKEAEQACLECMQFNQYRYPEALSSIFLQPSLLDHLGCKRRLADLYAFSGKSEAGIRLYEEVIKLLKECYPNSEIYKKRITEDLCSTLSNLGFAHEYSGNHHFAELAYKESCSYAEKTLESIKENNIELKQIYISALTNLVETLVRLNQVKEANRYLKKVEASNKEVLPNETYGIIKSNIATVSGNLSPEERLEMRKEAIRLLETTKDVTFIADIQLSVAKSYIELGRLVEAKEYLLLAKRNKPSDVAYSNGVYSMLAQAQNKRRKALKLLNKVINEVRPENAHYPNLWQQKAVISAQLKNIAAAKSSQETALRIMNQRIQTFFPYLSESQREQYLDDYDISREYYFSLSCLNKPDSGTTGKLYDLVLSSKGVLLEAVRQTKAGISITTDTLLNQKQSRYSYNKNLLARYYRSGQKEDWMDVGSLETETEALEKEISRAVLANQPKKPTWQQIQIALKPGEAAVEIVRFRLWDSTRTPGKLFGTWRDSVYYAALILTPASVAPQLVVLPNGRALEGPYLQAYRTDIQRHTYDVDSYRQFWQPIQQAVAGVKTIYFSPDGVYHQINLGTLRNTETGYFLSEEVDIHLVENTQTLVDTLKTQPRSTTIALIGYPDYQQVSISQKKESPAATLYYNLLDFDRGNDLFPSLPGTKEEVTSIQNIATQQGWTAQLLTDGEASEENVKKIKNTRVVHIATHGYFLKDTSKIALTKRALLNTGLVLAGALDSTNKKNLQIDDGFLTAYEVAGLPLKGTELVTLSACETGLGLIRNGNGVFGLQRAFLAAGAENVLMSLWRVNDLVTKELMEKFYRYWLVDGLKKQEALSKAQKDIRETSVQLSHPYYWGGFVLTQQ